MINLILDSESSGFYIYGNYSEELIVRPKEIYEKRKKSKSKENFKRLSMCSYRDR